MAAIRRCRVLAIGSRIQTPSVVVEQANDTKDSFMSRREQSSLLMRAKCILYLPSRGKAEGVDAYANA